MSILSPTSWNLVYDKILGVKRRYVEAVAFVDDRTEENKTIAGTGKN